MEKKIFFMYGMVLLIGILFSTNLVSAEETVCCQKTTSGAWCSDAPADQCDNDYSTNPNSCEATNFCQTGYCFDSSEGTCAAGAPKIQCDDEGGEWSRNYNVNLCQLGCCFLGENTPYVTETRCQILADRIGFPEPRFDATISERECRFYSQTEGACVVNQNSCRYTTEENCVKNFNGEFFAGEFCSEINENYRSHDNKICYNGDIYWTDDKGNREDLFENCEDGKEACFLGSNGDPYCKSLQCFDEGNDKLRSNGESWCRYDAYVGESSYTRTESQRYLFVNIDVGVVDKFSSDVIGSEHCKQTCVDGEITTECSQYRGEICAEKIDNRTGISTAQLRQNLGGECFNIDNVEECNDHPDCRIQSIDVDTYFKFDTCVPKYPIGFDVTSGNSRRSGEDVCGLASLTCEVLWDRDSFLTGADDCKENCDCEDPEFREEMDNLCVSLGDCGGYINYVGASTVSSPIAPSACEFLERFQNWGIFKTWFDKYCAQTGRLESILEVLVRPNIIGVNTPEFFSRIFQRNKFIPDSLTKIGYRDVRGVEMGGDDELRAVRYTCAPWQPPVGGDDCGKCSEDPNAPCTEYRCHSLGGACEIIPETLSSDNPICVDMYSDDPQPPQISFGEISSLYRVTNGANGVSISLANGQCPVKYNDVSFTLETDEIAKCYTVANLSGILEGLEGERNYTTVHSRTVRLVNDNNMRLYTICQDKAGNINENEFLIDICVNPQPDVTAPRIDRFIPESGSFLAYGKTNLTLEVQINEPADCRYESVPNVAFEIMTNEMTCNKLQTSTFGHTCSANINDLTEPTNNIYIRCNDSSGNINTQDATYTIFSTQTPLAIDSVYPDNDTTIKKPISRNDPLILEVETSGGAYNGISVCEYKFLDQGWSDIFTETDSTIHKYSILSNLSAGDYGIEFTCKDKAGNVATRLSEFQVEIDTIPPVVVRAYHDTANNRLRLITNEDARCYYNNIEACSPFSFDNSRSMTTAFSTSHSAPWDESRTYYIKCEDLFENRNPSCAIIVKPSQ